MKVAIYCRLSEEDRNKQFETDDSNSIQNQKSMLLQYSMEQGWELYNIYSDDDYTGADRRCPEFNRLLKDAEQHKFDIILCKTQSRFTRELELVEKYIHGLFLFPFREKELVYRYVKQGYKLIQNLQTWVLPAVLNGRDISRRNIQLIR